MLWKAIEIVKHHLNFSHHGRYKLKFSAGKTE
jgi:hypothetical protein